MKNSLASLFVGLALCSSISIQAAEDEKRWFEVEIIIFERLTENAQSKEHWEELDVPALSRKHIDPFSLFLDEKNLISYQLAASASQTTLTASAAISTQPVDIAGSSIPSSEIAINTVELVTDSSPQIVEEIPLLAFNDDLLPINTKVDNEIELASATNNEPILETTPEIDGAELTAEVKDPEFDIASTSDFKLTEQVQALKNHANYNLLLHSAWRMPPVLKRKAIPIRVFAGKNYQSSFNLDGSPIPVLVNDTSAVISEEQDTSGTTIVAESILPPLWQLDGELLIYLDHYLYAETKLYIRQEITREVSISELALSEKQRQQNSDQDLLSLSSLTNALTTDDNAVIKDQILEQVTRESELESFLQSYPMKQLRVIRSGEIHYFDHPKFGMVMQIRKYTKPEPVIEESITPESQLTDELMTNLSPEETSINNNKTGPLPVLITGEVTPSKTSPLPTTLK